MIVGTWVLGPLRKEGLSPWKPQRRRGYLIEILGVLEVCGFQHVVGTLQSLSLLGFTGLVSDCHLGSTIYKKAIDFPIHHENRATVYPDGTRIDT